MTVQGYLAAGKSTFAQRLAGELRVPCFMKDTFKAALCRQIPLEDRAMKRRFSAVTFDAMCYAAERLLSAGVPVILEGNFVPAGVKAVDEAGALRALAERYHADVLTYHFVGDTRVLHCRFMERENTAERGAANVIGQPVPYATFEGWCRSMDGFDLGGRCVTVDTTDFAAVDQAALIRQAAQFFKGCP